MLIITFLLASDEQVREFFNEQEVVEAYHYFRYFAQEIPGRIHEFIPHLEEVFDQTDDFCWAAQLGEQILVHSAKNEVLKQKIIERLLVLFRQPLDKEKRIKEVTRLLLHYAPTYKDEIIECLKKVFYAENDIGRRSELLDLILEYAPAHRRWFIDHALYVLDEFVTRGDMTNNTSVLFEFMNKVLESAPESLDRLIKIALKILGNISKGCQRWYITNFILKHKDRLSPEEWESLVDLFPPHVENRELQTFFDSIRHIRDRKTMLLAGQHLEQGGMSYDATGVVAEYAGVPEYLRMRAGMERFRNERRDWNAVRASSLLCGRSQCNDPRWQNERYRREMAELEVSGEAHMPGFERWKLVRGLPLTEVERVKAVEEAEAEQATTPSCVGCGAAAAPGGEPGGSSTESYEDMRLRMRYAAEKRAAEEQGQTFPDFETWNSSIRSVR